MPGLVSAGDVYLPVTHGGREPNTELYLGYVEILDHCVTRDEILDCVEFPHASQLSDRDCAFAVASAEAMCIVIGAPVEQGVEVP